MLAAHAVAVVQLLASWPQCRPCLLQCAFLVAITTAEGSWVFLHLQCTWLSTCIEAIDKDLISVEASF